MSGSRTGDSNTIAASSRGSWLEAGWMGPEELNVHLRDRAAVTEPAKQVVAGDPTSYPVTVRSRLRKDNRPRIGIVEERVKPTGLDHRSNLGREDVKRKRAPSSACSSFSS
jgi:hypothetical protein